MRGAAHVKPCKKELPMLLNKRISVWEFVRHIRVAVLYILLYAAAIGILDEHPWLSKIVIPLSVSAIVGTALSLLLAFRTSQSYERWWEARVVWGAIVNDSRTLVRQVQLYLPAHEGGAMRTFAERQIVWCFALGESLRKVPHSSRVAGYLQANGIADSNIPNGLLNAHSRQLKELAEAGLVSEFAQLQMDTTLGRLCDSMGRCERIKNTVFPRNYSLLIHSLIYVFATILPFGLDDNFIVVEILITVALPVIFIVIEKTAILMQDPFENLPLDTPVTTLAGTIETNILQALGEAVPPSLSNENSYYIM